MDFNPSWVILKSSRGWGKFDVFSLSSIISSPSLPKRIFSMAIPILRNDIRDYLFVRDEDNMFDTSAVGMEKDKGVYTNKKLWQQLAYKVRELDRASVV